MLSRIQRAVLRSRSLRLFRLRQHLLSSLFLRHLPLWVSAILIGLIACLFSFGSAYAHKAFYAVYDRSPYAVLAITPLGLGLSVWLLRRFFSGYLGGGIPQAIAALDPGAKGLREKILTLRAVIGQILLTLIGIACGATFGFEGPIVQVGAAVNYRLNRHLAERHDGAARGIILAGAAASVAAAFNAPLAGIVFAIEEIGHTFEQKASSTMLLMVIVAGLTSMSVEGSYNYFGITSVTLGMRTGWVAVLSCGIAGGLVGAASSRLLLTISSWMPRPLARLRALSPVGFAMLCGLVLAAIGLACDGSTFGTGYYRARQILLQGGDGLEWYGVLKWLSMVISFISGAPGGMLAPSLAVGAGFGLNIASLFPSLPQTAIVLLGMVGFFSGLTQAPMTGFVIVMEMSDSSSMILPLMVSGLIAARLSRMLSRKALYPELAHQLLRRTAAGNRVEAVAVK
jgi:H+/Cl- antiporter ClcA